MVDTKVLDGVDGAPTIDVEMARSDRREDNRHTVARPCRGPMPLGGPHLAHRCRAARPLPRQLSRSHPTVSGCGEPHKEMADNIRYEDVKQAAGANGMTIAETVEKIQRALEVETSEQGARG